MIGEAKWRRGSGVLFRGASVAIACSLLLAGQALAAKPARTLTAVCDASTTTITWSGFRPVELRGSWVLDIGTNYNRYVVGSFAFDKLTDHSNAMETPEVDLSIEINGLPVLAFSSWTLRVYGVAYDRAGNAVRLAGSPYSGTGVPTAPACASYTIGAG
jgi:hypothetical protein